MAEDNENERRVIGEFMDELRDSASALQVLVGNLRSKTVPMGDGLEQLRRDSDRLRTQAHVLGLPMIKLVTHRLAEYVADLSKLTDRQIDELQVFVDRIERLADGEQVTEADMPSMVRALPAKRPVDVDFGCLEQKNIEVLLVVPERAMARIIERELAACGYRTSVARSPFEAIETVVHTRPDMVVAAMELGLLSGVDLGCALAAMPTTQATPFALLTSYELGHPKLKGLPPRAALLRKGSRFGDDIAETFARFGIT